MFQMLLGGKDIVHLNHARWERSSAEDADVLQVQLFFQFLRAYH